MLVVTAPNRKAASRRLRALRGLGDPLNPSGNPIQGIINQAMYALTPGSSPALESAGGANLTNLATGQLTPQQVQSINAASGPSIQNVTNPITGAIDNDALNYFINGGCPPASVLAVDPSAQCIISLPTLTSSPSTGGPLANPLSISSLPAWAWIALASFVAIVIVAAVKR